jgi:succinyl-diaminopimelate desuccinylase
MNVLELAEALIAKPSITPEDAGCQELISEQLRAHHFQVTDLSADKVTNIWARYGDAEPLVIFAGHTDVVDPGPLTAWNTDPFVPTIHNGMLIGRGAQDMKGPLAAMLIAAQQFVKDHPKFPGSIGFAITSAEEGDDYAFGTPIIVKHLQDTNQKVEWCVIGEPSCAKTFGDCIKNGRRGSLHAHLIIHGIQGHVAYPDKADNPIHKSLPALNVLQNIVWCNGGVYFPPTSMQIVHIQAGHANVGNVIPGDLHVRINWRYSAELTAEDIQQQVEALLTQYGLNFTVRWDLSGEPFITPAGKLTELLQETINEITGVIPELSTVGGTSDGRFLAKLGCQTIEFGSSNNSIHQVNEQVSIVELEKLTEIYYRLLEKLFIN